MTQAARRRGTGVVKKTASVAKSRRVNAARNPTINDIARLAGVSKKTVSRVLNRSPLIREHTRTRVQTIMDQQGYVPDPQARGLALRRSFLIGMVYDNPNAQYVVNMLDGALDALRGTDYELVVHPCNRHNPDLINSVRAFAERQKLRGVILLPPVSGNHALTGALAAIDCAYVCVSSGPPDALRRMVVSNDRDAVSEAANYLESLGHRRIALISGPRDYLSSAERRGGFLAALQARGISVADDYLVEGGYTYASGVACADMLLARKPRPTAIFACNDEMAAGVYRSAQRFGLAIPGDLSVIGFDDGPLAERLLPSLTTVRLPIRDIGRIAASRLITGEAALPDATPLVPHLVVRDSCQAPRS